MKNPTNFTNPFSGANGAMNGFDPASMGAIEDAMGRYGGKSEDELLGELIGGKQSGSIDPAQLKAVASRIAPMLSPEQRTRLESILTKLGE